MNVKPEQSSANELADKQAFEQGELSMWIRNETDTMLRQQQAEIEALKAKTLTDEEIIETGNAVTNLIDSNEGWIEFARAILRKANEK